MLSWQLGHNTDEKGLAMSTINYHKEKSEAAEAKVNAAWIKLQEYFRDKGGLTEELIKIWVEGTMESQWQGWHDYGLIQAKESAGWSRRDCLICDETTEHDSNNLCTVCHSCSNCKAPVGKGASA